jgi:predicted TPR repeat methyltransferase
MTSVEMGLQEADRAAGVIEGWELADPAFARASRHGSSTGQALAGLGVRLCIAGRYPESLRVLRLAETISPGDPELLNNLAVVQDRSNLRDEAIRTVEKSLALKHAQPDSWVMLGNMKRMRGDPAGAQAAYETAIALEKSSPLAWLGLSLVRQAQRRPAEAIECLKTCIRQSHANAPLCSILGQLYYESGRFGESRDAYLAAVDLDGNNAVYRQMQRETQFICAAIEGSSIDEAIAAYLNHRAEHPAGADPDLHKFLQKISVLLDAHGHNAAARRIAEARLARSPASVTARYMLQAAAGDSSILRAPDAYIVEHFDEFADAFEEQLVNKLGYDIPRKLAAQLARFLPDGARVDLLDAGCGTGLCGPWVRGLSARLTGVDLSSGMLRHANQRQIYDRLVRAELTSFLRESPAGFDAIIAADVMIYFGDLAPLEAAIAGALKPDGLLAFSTERASSPGCRFQGSGRFAHDPGYVQSVFSAHFTMCAAGETTIRFEASRPVPGNLFVFQRKGHLAR